ncbi:hypothetical protein BH23CHL8_BH23CHL8_27530 [soil metagenome]
MRLLALPLAIALLAAVLPFTAAAALPEDPDLRGRVWRDVNADGVRQRSERGVADVAVVLFGRTTGQDDPVQLATTTTDRDGRYGFAGLDEGEYLVRFALPSELASPIAA